MGGRLHEAGHARRQLRRLDDFQRGQQLATPILQVNHCRHGLSVQVFRVDAHQVRADRDARAQQWQQNGIRLAFLAGEEHPVCGDHQDREDAGQD